MKKFYWKALKKEIGTRNFIWFIITLTITIITSIWLFSKFGIALVIENIALSCLMNELSRAKEIIVKINEQYSINKTHWLFTDTFRNLGKVTRGRSSGESRPGLYRSEPFRVALVLPSGSPPTVCTCWKFHGLLQDFRPSALGVRAFKRSPPEVCRLLAVLSGLLLYPKETAPPDVGGGRPLRRLWEPMGGNLWSFREFFSRREAGGAESQTEKRSTTPKRDTGNESIKKASRSAPRLA